MARPVEFDRSATTQSALLLFWSKGYQATSLADLVGAMGISRSSLYGAYGDKRGVFIECLDLFAARSIQMLVEARAQQTPLEALRTFFVHTLSEVTGGRWAWGCMLVNTVLEMANVDEALCDHARLRLAEVEAAFEACLNDTGCGPAKAAELSAFLMLVNEGLRVSSRRALPERAHRDQIDTTFRLLESALT
ncbi:MAG: TetR/AcrR family transcriptional regulator [Phenylobacterium sp.]|nr:TetR/AcrR family transcriptional regulator [Phenylobacterium sp.]